MNNLEGILRDVAAAARKRYGLAHKPRSSNIYTVDNYTIVIIPAVGGSPKAIGVSKRNPKDKFNQEIGVRIAYARALKQLASKTT